MEIYILIIWETNTQTHLRTIHGRHVALENMASEMASDLPPPREQVVQKVLLTPRASGNGCDMIIQRTRLAETSGESSGSVPQAYKSTKWGCPGLI
jgi:hypothetical protein